MNRVVPSYLGFLLAAVVGLMISLPLGAAEMDTQSLPSSSKLNGESGHTDKVNPIANQVKEIPGPVRKGVKEMNPFSRRQFPSWVEDAWLEYQAERSGGRLKEASDVLAKIRKRALFEGVQRFNFASAVLIQEGEEALLKGKLDAAVELAEAAKEWSPNDPNSLLFLTKVQFHQNPFNPMAAIGSYIQALSAGVGDFWFLFYSVGELVLVLFAGLFGAFMVFFVLLLVRYLPMLVHSLYELSSAFLNPSAVWVLVGTLLMTPIMIGAGAGMVLLIGVCFVWLYMTRSERIVSVLMIFSLGFSGYWLPGMLSWFTADQSNELVLLSNVLQGDAAATGSAQVMESQGGYERNWPLLVSLAIQKRREGNLTEALEGYLRLRKQEPDRAIILNNIGNIYFLMNQYDEAVAYYKESLEKNPRDAISHYNLSLVYRDLLRFNDAKQEIDTAQQINLPLIESFHGVGPINAIFSERILWETAFARSPLKEGIARDLFEGVMSPLSFEAAVTLPVLFAAGLIFIRLLIPRKVAAGECSLCGRSICFHCQRRILDLKTCSSCWNGSKNVKRKSELRQFKIRQRWIHKTAQWSSALMPGAGHLYIGQGIRGFSFAAVFLAMIFSILFRDHLFHFPGERGGVFGFLGYLAVVLGFAFFYLLVLFDLQRASHERS
jgi:tetratricopeptide (TPR) repeat protein